jgi:hypothetical protein
VNTTNYVQPVYCINHFLLVRPLPGFPEDLPFPRDIRIGWWSHYMVARTTARLAGALSWWPTESFPPSTTIKFSSWDTESHKEKSNKMHQCIRLLLFHICMRLNMFRATHRPLSGA